MQMYIYLVVEELYLPFIQRKSTLKLVYRDPYLDFSNGKCLRFTGDSELMFDLIKLETINKLGSEIEMK